jgi:hypothetical protein
MKRLGAFLLITVMTVMLFISPFASANEVTTMENSDSVRVVEFSAQEEKDFRDSFGTGWVDDMNNPKPWPSPIVQDDSGESAELQTPVHLGTGWVDDLNNPKPRPTLVQDDSGESAELQTPVESTDQQSGILGTKPPKTEDEWDWIKGTYTSKFSRTYSEIYTEVMFSAPINGTITASMTITGGENKNGTVTMNVYHADGSLTYSEPFERRGTQSITIRHNSGSTLHYFGFTGDGYYSADIAISQ